MWWSLEANIQYPVKLIDGIIYISPMRKSMCSRDSGLNLTDRSLKISKRDLLIEFTQDTI